MRLGPIDLYKKLPATNCGDCGQPSCLAFATQVVGYGHEVEECPHLKEDTLQEIEQTLERQREKGVYLKKENHKITREHLKEKIKDHNFEAISPGLEVGYSVDDGVEALEIPYFGRAVTMRRTGIVRDKDEEFDPWDEVLLYNYIFFPVQSPGRETGWDWRVFPTPCPSG
jgi:hypothetical protein